MVFAGSFPEHRIATVLVMASVIVTTGGLLWVANRSSSDRCAISSRGCVT